MSMRRIAAIAGIFGLATGGWMVLGATTATRSVEFAGRLGAQVEELWGTPLVQEAPALKVEIPGADRARTVLPEKNVVDVSIRTDYRKRGLIWYPTYVSSFDGKYSLTNDEEVAQKIRVHFKFPDPRGTYDAFHAAIDDKTIQSEVNTAEGINEIVELAPGQSATLHVSYATRGIREWRYRMSTGPGRVRNLKLTVNTNFADVDYPDGCLSPTATVPTSDGMALTWQATDLITQEDVGVIIPEKLNPGPLTSRITFFAPVCLLFFFVLVVTINVVGRVNIHPMHYLFVAAGFFAFHLLLAYMAGLVNIHVAFVISAIVSMGLVTGYLSAALRQAFPWKASVAGQCFFLVLFSYSFFLKGMTGLTVAVGSVITLAVLMKLTAHVNWDDVFASKAPPLGVPPLPPQPVKE